MSAGTSCGTAAFAVSALRPWWQREGAAGTRGRGGCWSSATPAAPVPAPGRLWKDQLAVLARETGLLIRVCHFPPGTSKWNKIEHRLFCRITRTWRGPAADDSEDAVAGIAATATCQGLKVHRRPRRAVTTPTESRSAASG